MQANGIERIAYRPRDFRVIRELMLDYAGINLNESKQELVYTRLVKRVRRLGLDNFNGYCDLLKTDDNEMLDCINALTTNVTSFFREHHHFEYLQRVILASAAKNQNEPLRIWSAGCSTGQEPYSVAFTCMEAQITNPELSVQILATDLDTDVINSARQGVYKLKDITGLNERQRKKWFLKGKGPQQGRVKVNSKAQKLIEFTQLNLKENWNHEVPFDLILCRNVMIYFNGDLRKKLIEKFSHSLKIGGHLMLGHSESMFGLNTSFKLAGKTIHQKITGDSVAQSS